MIITALIHTRRHHTRAELQRMLTATQHARDLAIGRARATTDTLAAMLERLAAGYDEDATWLDRPGTKQHGTLNANQRRAIADELRNCARDIDGHRTRPTPSPTRKANQ